MWTWYQTIGQMYHDDAYFGKGYSGRYGGKNNAKMQDVKLTGPLPVGAYRIGDLEDHPRLGKDVMALTPDPSNQMFGRGDFFIHDENPDHIGMSSEGCIVLGHIERMEIGELAKNGERLLEVLAERNIS